MKIRQGFISNSSTSNFLIYGFKVPYKDSLEKDVEDFNNKTGLNFNCLYGVGEEVIIGKVFFDIDSAEGSYIDNLDIDQLELNNIANKVDDYAKYITDVFKVNPIIHLMAGTRSS